jgi:transketolase
MLEKIWQSPSPTYLRANTRKSVYNHEPFEIGIAEIISKGTDITFLVYGPLFEQVIEAKKLLEIDGKSVGVVNMRSLAPVDEEVIINVCKNCEQVVTVEDHFLTGGLYTIVAEVLLKNRLSANVMPIAFENRWFRPGLLSEVLEYEKLTGNHLAERVAEMGSERLVLRDVKWEVEY